jgi:hypothetical protein
MINKVRRIIKEYITWEDYVFLGVLIVYLALIIRLLSQLNQMPSPIYGGDYYFSMGTVYHFVSGGNPFVSSSFIGGLPAYLPVYTLLAGGFIKMLGLEVFFGMKVFSVILLIASLAVFYAFISYMFKDKLAGIISLTIGLPFISYPYFKYLQFTITVFFPLFIFSLYYFFKKRTLKSAVVLGIIFGILGISHTIGFITGCFVIFFFSVYILFIERLDWKNKKIFEYPSFIRSLKLLFVMGIIAFVIAQIFWFKPLFVFHGATQTGIVDYSQQDLSIPGVEFNLTVELLKSLFFNLDGLFNSLKTLLFDMGVLLLFFFVKKDNEMIKFTKIFFISSILTIFHYIYLYPIIGTHLVPSYMIIFLSVVLTGIITTFAIITLAHIKFGARKFAPYILIFIVILFLSANALEWKKYTANDRWINAGKSKLSPDLSAMQEFILKNSNVNDVFLSNNELGFSLNALTGRKVVNFRRGHSDSFTNIDERLLDAAVILYGNNDAERIKLINKYGIKYLYWSYYWINSEYIIEDGKIVNTYDPIVLRDTNENREALLRYNISFIAQHTWLDPSIKGPTVRQFDTLFIMPSRFDYSAPWNEQLNQMLSEVWNYEVNNQKIAIIYKINN